MRKLSCPFCNTVFDVAAPVPDRIPCPRCEQIVPATALAPEGAHAVEVVDPSLPRGSSRLFWIIVVSLVLFAVAAFIADSLWETKLPPTQPTEKGPAQAVTKPPLMLSSLRYLPANSQIVFSIQPAVLVEYTQRKGQSVDIWLAKAGLPGKLFDEFRSLGLAPEQIDQLTIAMLDSGIAVSVMLVLRQPLENESEFRTKLKAQTITDKPGHYTVDLFTLPMEMKKADETTYRFVSTSQSKLLDAPAAAGNDHLPQGLRDSLGKLSPATFAWLASDTASPDWSANDKVKLLSLDKERAELPKRLEKVRAIALGFATEPELVLSLAVRSSDPKTLADQYRERLTTAKATVAVDGDWATARMPFDPPDESLAALRKALGQ
jgi:hypothetical protein